MLPVGLEAPRALTRRPLLRLLLLLWLLLWPVTRARTTQGTRSASTRPDTSSVPTAPGSPRAPSLHERARALMRDFRLVDGCVGAACRLVGAEPAPGQERKG